MLEEKYLLEKYLIEYCAPTLAALKTASLFCVPVKNGCELDMQIKKLDDFLNRKGLTLLVLKRYENRALIYLYRKSHLQKDLLKPGVENFLKKLGYNSIDEKYLLERIEEENTEVKIVSS